LSRARILLLIMAVYVTLASLCSLLAVKPAFNGLSTILGTTVLGTTVLGTTVLGTTVLGTSRIQGYADALAIGQLAISLMTIGLFVYRELSDPFYGKADRRVEELRKSWLPLSVLLVLLFAFVVAFRVWAILG